MNWMNQKSTFKVNHSFNEWLKDESAVFVSVVIAQYVFNIW